VTGTTYAAAASGGETWSVRAVLLESGGAGSYYNASQAAFVDTAAPPAAFYTLTPCRVIDTRRAAGPLGGPALSAAGSRTVVAAASCGIPSDARSVSANVTVTSPTSNGYLTVYPGGQSTPLASTVNYRAGQTRANNAILTLGSSGDLVVYTGQASGSVHFVVDVTGYFK
jgi:hypothetical protein